MKKIIPFLAAPIVAVVLSACSPPPPPPPLVLQFRLVQDVASGDTEPMPQVTHDQENYFTNMFNVEKRVLLDQTAVKSATAVKDALGHPRIQIEFTAAGGRELAEITRQHIKQRLAIIIDGQICEAPIIYSEISGGEAEIAGNFSEQETKDLVWQLNALSNKE